MTAPAVDPAPALPTGAPAGPTPAAVAIGRRRSLLARAAALNPFPSLFGPIFQKEVRSAGRRRTTYVLRAGYVLGLLAIVCLAFLAARTSTHSTGVQRIQEMQTLAPVLTSVAMWFQFIAMILVAPLLAAPVICDERRARSLATLLTTPLRSRDIILGKLSSRIVQLAILTLLVAPILLAVRIFGGVEATIVIAFTCVSLSLGVLGAALGVLYSIWHRRATSAALFALLSLALIQGGPSAIEGIRYYVVTGMLGHEEAPLYIEQVAVTASPYALAGLNFSIVTGGELPWFTINSPWLYEQVGGILDPDGIHGPASIPILPVWAVSSLYNLLAAGVVLQISILMLRRTMRREAGESVSPARVSRKRRKRPVAAADEPAQTTTSEEDQIRERKRLRMVSDQPILWRELRHGGMGTRRMRIAIAVVTVCGMVLLYALAGVRNEGLQMTMAVLGSLIVMCQVVFMTTGSIATEREGRTWEVLLTTPLTGREIIVGKLLGTLRAQWFLPTVVFTHFVISVIAGAIPLFFLLQLLLILAGPIFFFSATGQFFSLAIRKGIIGAVLNLVLAVTLWGGLWLFVGLYGWLTQTHGEDLEMVGSALYSINPLLMAGSACEPVARGTYGRQVHWGANLQYQMAFDSKTFDSFQLWMLGAFAFYIAAGTGVLALTVSAFRNLSGRSS